MSKRKSFDAHETPCEHYGARAGIVTNQPDGYDHDRSHCSVSVCGDPTCRALSIAYVKHVTGEMGVYISDSTRKVTV